MYVTPASALSPYSLKKFPFQAYPGNPGMHIPWMARCHSSISVTSSDHYALTHSPSALSIDLEHPHASFLAKGSQSALYRSSIDASNDGMHCWDYMPAQLERKSHTRPVPAPFAFSSTSEPSTHHCYLAACSRPFP
jgi:hypothetical protein